MNTIAEITSALGANADSFCRAYLPNGRRSGRYWTVGDVTGAAGKSLAIRLTGFADRREGTAVRGACRSMWAMIRRMNSL